MLQIMYVRVTGNNVVLCHSSAVSDFSHMLYARTSFKRCRLRVQWRQRHPVLSIDAQDCACAILRLKVEA